MRHPRRPPAAARRDVPLADLTTLGVGGPARFFVDAPDPDAIADALAWAREAALPVLVLGGGSNLLFADAGFDGLVVRVASRGVEPRSRGDRVELTVAAGEPWDALVRRAVAEGWAGIECLVGIPGAVGAAPIQNIGAYGQEVAEVLVAVDTLDRLTGEPRRFTATECAFGYRTSRFKADPQRRHLVTGVVLSLAPGGAPTVRYGQVVDAIGDGAPDLAKVSETVHALRRSKSMVIDPADPNRRSAGSFFLNPIVPSAEADAVADRVKALGVDPATMPRYPQGDGRDKLSAAWLIDRAGLHKGYGEGPVGLSTRHTLALVNRGGATAADVVAFAAHVRGVVRDRFGVALHPEPVFVGFDRPADALLDALLDAEPEAGLSG